METKKDLEQVIDEKENGQKTFEELLAEMEKAANDAASAMEEVVEAVSDKIDKALGLAGDELPEEIRKKAEEIRKETGMVTGAETPEEPVEEEPEIIPSMDEFQEELEASFRRIQAGDVMTGTVVGVDETGVLLDLNFYAPGKIPADQMSNDPHFSIMEDVHVGDVIEATVTKRDDGAGNILLSRKEADDTLAWDRLNKLKEEKTVISAKINEVSPKGVIIYVEGVRGFVPASRLALQYVEDTAEYMGKTIDVQVFDVIPEEKRLILSAKELLQEKAIEEKNQKIALLTVGNIVEGTVESIRDFGAFVSIGDGISGLLHISQIAERRITNVRSVLKEGQKVKVLITKVDNGKVSLSMKAAEEVLNTEKSEEGVEEFNDHTEATTSLGDLLKGLKF